jgi:hypothetical protein
MTNLTNYVTHLVSWYDTANRLLNATGRMSFTMRFNSSSYMASLCINFGGEFAEVERVWNLMAHGDAREGKRRGNWRMAWLASTLTLPRNVEYPALLPLMCTPLLPAVDWTDAPADLNGLVRFGERRNLVSASVPSRFKRSQPRNTTQNCLGSFQPMEAER